MFGIVGSALVGLAQPKNPALRTVGFAGWIFSSYQGLVLSLEHVDYQFNPSPFKTCDVFVNFPSWLPLNEWVPSVFEAYGDCSKIVWQFVGLSMPQWLVIIFAVSLLVGLTFAALQLVGLKKSKA